MVSAKKSSKRIRQNEKSMRIILFCLVGWLCWEVVYDLEHILDFNHYLFMFQDLPPQLIVLRYWGSIGLRLLTLVAAFGMVMGKEGARRLMIYISVYTIVTIYFKHPYSAIVNSNIYWNLNMSDFERVASLPWNKEIQYYPLMAARMMNLCAKDILKSVFVILMLNAPKMQKLFK
jgi:hypothetical protein